MDKKQIMNFLTTGKDNVKKALDTGKENVKNTLVSLGKKSSKSIQAYKSKKEPEDDYRFNESDYHYMESLSAAVLEHAPRRVSVVLYMWVFSALTVIIWASFASIDEITRGSGDVVASGDNKVVQNLEGGIVDEILVQEGDIVEANQILIKITNNKSSTMLDSNSVKINELEAKAARLKAQANGSAFNMEIASREGFKKFIDYEKTLYDLNMAGYKEGDVVLREQIEQKKYAYRETRARINHLKKTVALIKEEVTMTAPMVKEGIKSKVDFLKLRREYNDVEQKYISAKLSLPSLNSEIIELRGARKEHAVTFKNESKQELNAVLAEIDRINVEKDMLKDQVSRTYVKSPVDGIVQKMYVKTKGGVIRPGDDIIEIVPSHDKLLLEIKIKPSDIAFLHPGAKAMVKFSAYDFAIHGGLEGEITRISPDTVSDEKDGTYYLVYIKTDKSYLGTIEHPLNIIPGMLADVDIVTGQKTVMQYILKPILKSKQYVFSER